MQIGAAWEDITPDRPLHILGQMHVRTGKRTNDPLTVNAVAFAEGERRVVLVSCDLCLLPDEDGRAIQAACAAAHGLPAAAVLIACTHTHVAPCTVSYLAGERDVRFMADLQQAVVKAVGRALADLGDATLFAATGWLREMGYNRRGRHADGRVDMYHGSWNADFAGVEGPRDGDVPVIFARRPDGSVKVIITGFASHPNCIEGEECYSADLPGAVRAALRRRLGDDLNVVYLTGSGGNTAPSQLEHNPERKMPWRGFDGLRRSGEYLALEVQQAMLAASEPMADQSLDWLQAAPRIPIRPWPAGFPGEIVKYPAARAYYERCHAAWPQFIAAHSPVEVRVNVVRLGHATICSNPGEFYVEHGLAIRQASPAAVTMISQLTDGYCGYIPTVPAFRRGGYSTWPAFTSKLAEDAGDIIVGETRKLLAHAFAGRPLVGVGPRLA